MKTKKIQHKLDIIIDRITLRFLPKKVTPNQLTITRLALVPVVYGLLVNNYILAGFIVFFIAAATDAMDGALARTTDRVTDFGKLMDPIADKLLIGSVFLYIGFDYLIVKIFIAVIFLEILSVFLSAVAKKAIGRPIGANVYGKIKMALQTLAVIMFLVGLISEIEILILISEWVLFLALFFALISGLEQMRLKWERLREKRKR